MESNGPDGASEDVVEVPVVDRHADADLLREEGDGASTSSSVASDDFESFEKLQAEMMWGGMDKDDDDLLNVADSFNWHQQDEKLLEELFRLKLTSVNPSPFGSGTAASAVSGASLPPKQRIKLYQPRTKLEQFEDILLESQLLETSLPEYEVAAIAEAAGLTVNDLEFDLMEGFDFEASDAIFNEAEEAAVPESESAVPLTKDHENTNGDKTVTASSSLSNSSSLASSTCDCLSCRERHSIEAKESDELKRLQKCWLEVREDVKRVYRLVLGNAWNDPNRFEERPDLNTVKEKVHKLVWRDAHQLFRRLEAAVKEFVLEIKLKLIDLLQKQAKNPSLAQDFIQYLLEGYERVCTAAQHVAPALMDLEVEHLRRFSLTWEVLNKHLYQSIIYVDPLIENNLPIFLSQLRSLFPDKEHEARYTELVRGYLDFDVEMVNIGAFWKTSETMINEYNEQQNQLRTKQQMLKEDWERFKAQRKALEKQIRNSSKEQEPPNGVEKCECDVCLTPGIPPLGQNLSIPSPSNSSYTTGECSSAAAARGCQEKMPDLAKLYPHLMQTIKQGGLSTLSSPAFLKENQGLAALFPSLLTVDGPKLPTSASVAAELSQALSTALSLTDTMPDSTTSHLSESLDAIQPSSEVLFTQQKDSKNSAATKATVDKINLSEHVNSSDNSANKTAGSIAKKSNAEITALLQQHYCSHKNKKKPPSASAIRKGKVPMPPSCVIDDGDSTDELSEDSSSLPPDDTCSSASSITSHGHGSTNGKACTCCYCEVFGHNSGVSGGQTVAPVSRNYPEMRERLRLLLSKKKKKEQAHCKQQMQQQQQRSTKGVAQQQQQQQPSCSNLVSSTVTSSTSSVKSTTPNGNIAKKEVIQSIVPTLSTAAALTAAKKPTPQTNSASAAVPSTKPALPVSKASTPKPVAKPAAVANAQARSQSATSLAPSVPPPPLKLEKSRSAVAPKAAEGADKPSEKDLELLLEFIEGSAASANEKRKAKKERQKQQKLEEIRARKLEERRKQEAEEAETRRRQEEENRRLEMEMQMLKKAKKKAAQRAKKASANGVRIEDLVDTEEEVIKVTEKVPAGLEDLRARQMRELQELQAWHQKQMEEEQSKLVESKQQQQVSKKGNKKATKKGKEGSVPPSNSNALLNDVAKTGPGTQIKITRTASGGVEFTTIPADGVLPKKIPVEASPAVASPVPHHVLFNQFQMNPYSPQIPQLLQQQQQQAQPPAFMPSQQPSPDRPSVPSKMTPSQPMVTIRRIENPGLSEPTVTISTQGGAKESGKKLLYTLINGQVHRAKDAPEDLIPGAKPMPEDFTNKLFQSPMSQAPQPSQQLGASSRPTPQPRAALPMDNKGRLDLDRLQLPPGISITKIQGAAPQRKYFPSKPDTDQTVLPLPGTLNHSPPQKVIDSGFGYSAVAGMPMGMNGPNVIVVETSTLKTREEERKELEGKKKNKKKKSTKLVDQPASSPPVQQPLSNLSAFPYLAPQIPEVEGGNSLKSGPQVLIKNINGSVVITPIPSTPTNPNNAVNNNKAAKRINVGNGISKDRESPKSKQKPEPDLLRTEILVSSSAALLKKHVALGENIDEINSIFAPKDIDLDNGDIDEDEREIEAFKRFCLDSVPLQQKPKVNFDVRDINFKKK